MSIINQSYAWLSPKAGRQTVLLILDFILLLLVSPPHLAAESVPWRAWTVDPLIKVFREDGEDRAQYESTEVARGEHASVQMVVRSETPIFNLRAELSPFKHPSGQRILTPRAPRFVGYVPVDRPTQKPSKDQLRAPPADYPDPLWESAAVEVAAGQAQPVWLTIPIPTDALPGLYRGELTLTGVLNGKEQRLVKPVEIMVYSAVAGPARLWVTEWFAMQWRHMRISPEPESEEYYALLRRYARNMADHRHNVALISPLRLAHFTIGAHGSLDIDFTRFDRWVEIFQEEGVIGRIEGGHIGGRKGGWESEFVVSIRQIQDNRVVTRQVDPASAEARSFYARFFPALVAHLKAKNWLGLYMQHLADEPIQANIGSYQAMAALARKYAPELRIIEACHTKDLVGSIDIWVPQLNYLHNDFAHYQARQQAGEEVWFYTCVFPQGEYANRFLEQPLIKTRLLHWINYCYGVTGYLHWGYNQWTADSPFTHTTRPHGGPPYLPAGDPWIVYPGTNGPLDSIRFEAMRDGLADYALLEALGEKDPAAARDLAQRLVLGFDRYNTDVTAFRAVRRELLERLSKNGADSAWKALARLRLAENHVLQKDFDQARAEFGQVQRMADAPSHLRQEARERLQELDRLQQGWPAHDSAAYRFQRPPVVQPGLTFHVAMNGSDQNPGSREKPWATLERARDEIRRLKQAETLPRGGIQVEIGEGEYPVEQTFRLEARDSGTADSPIVFRASSDRRPHFRGGVRLRDFSLLKDPQVLGQLPEEARGKVWQTDLQAQGISSIIPLKLGGFASGSGFKTHPAMELFENGKAMPLARWPNEGFLRLGQPQGPETLRGWGSIRGAKEGIFTYAGDRPLRWKQEKDPWLYGYWFWDWADSYEKIESIDTEKQIITLSQPWHNYGYRKDQRYYALNLLSELDQPGEWYLDRELGRLYCYPNANPNQSGMEISLRAVPLVELRQVSHVRFEGLCWELGAADAIHIRGGEQVLLAGCVMRRFAGNGVVVEGGQNHGLLSCDIYSMGRGGTVVSGGDRKTLQAGGHFIENCHIHDLSRIDHTYTPAVLLNGVGNRLAHNLMHDIRSSAMRIEGNDHRIEYNEVHDVVWESDDQGGSDMFGNATYRGNIYRYNYWHHIGNWKNRGAAPDLGRAGIRLDDAISGVLIYGNVFYRASAGLHGFGGVQIHGGKDNILDNNLFIDCAAAVSFSPWGEKRWRDFVKNAMDNQAIDPELYLRRYPELKALSENHDANHLWRNLAYNCKEFLRHDSKRNTLVDNQVSSGPELAPPILPGWPGMRPIPFNEIGLYHDRYRPTLP